MSRASCLHFASNCTTAPCRLQKPPVFVMQVSIRIQNSKFPCKTPPAALATTSNLRSSSKWAKTTRNACQNSRFPCSWICGLQHQLLHSPCGQKQHQWMQAFRHLQLHMLNISSQRERVPRHFAQLSLSSFQVAVCAGPHSHEADNSEFHAGCDNSGQPQSQTTPEEKPTKMFRGN